MTPEDPDESKTLTHEAPASASGFVVSGGELHRQEEKIIPSSRDNFDYDDLLTVQQVCAILKVKPHTLANWACSKPRKGPPFKKIGRNRFYPEGLFRKWINR